MRDASPTGGALGQVAVRELELLQSTIASLDQGLDDQTLINNLEQVRTHIQNWKNAVDQSGSQQQEAGEQPQPAGSGTFLFNPETNSFQKVQ